VSPGHSLIQRVLAQSLKPSHAANNVTKKIKELESRKGVWRMCDQGPLGREGAPSMVSGVFAIVLSWMNIRIRCPRVQVPLPGVHNKTTKISRLAPQVKFRAFP